MHASKSQRALSSICHDAWIRPKLKKDAHYIKVVIDRGLHETCEAQVVHHVYVENILWILSLLDGPVMKQHFYCLLVALSAGDVQGITTVRVKEVYVDILLK